MARGRKQPKHFKVHCSIQNHAKTAVMAADNDLLALYVRLGLLAIERFADRTNDTFIISDRELPRLTGKYRADVARTLLSRLADVSPTSAERDGDVWRITIPNLAKKQGFAPPFNAFGDSPSSSSSTATSSVRKRERETPAAPALLTLDPDPIPAARNDRKKPKARRAPLPNPLTVQDREHIRQRSREFSVDPHALEQALCDWAYGGGYEYVDWGRQLGVMLRSRWKWTEPLFARPGEDGLIPNNRESAAQARVRRTNEAARGAFEILKAGGLVAIEGGNR